MRGSSPVARSARSLSGAGSKPCVARAREHGVGEDRGRAGAKRRAPASWSIMIGGVGGPASDIEIEARQISSLRERLNRTFAGATGQPYERIVKDTERNHWMTATEAVAYGLAGRIVQHESEL